VRTDYSSGALINISSTGRAAAAGTHTSPRARELCRAREGGVSDHPFYKSAQWRMLREFVIRRANGRCETPGSGNDGVIVDHVRPRRDGGSDTPQNLRLLCRRCDNMIK
jgi:HNH endonuclease